MSGSTIFSQPTPDKRRPVFTKKRLLILALLFIVFAAATVIVIISKPPLISSTTPETEPPASPGSPSSPDVVTPEPEPTDPDLPTTPQNPQPSTPQNPAPSTPSNPSPSTPTNPTNPPTPPAPCTVPDPSWPKGGITRAQYVEILKGNYGWDVVAMLNKIGCDTHTYIKHANNGNKMYSMSEKADDGRVYDFSQNQHGLRIAVSVSPQYYRYFESVVYQNYADAAFTCATADRCMSFGVGHLYSYHVMAWDASGSYYIEIPLQNR